VIARRTGPLACAVCLCVSLLGPFDRAAHAVGFTVTLEYAARPSCPDAADLKATVISRLGYDPFTDNAAHRVLVRIIAREGSLDGRIEWRDATGTWAGDQTFSRVSGECLPLVRAIAVALAVQIRLLATASEAPDSQVAVPAEPRPPAAPAPPPAPEETPAVTSPSTPSAPPPPPPNQAAPPAVSARSRPVFAIGAGPSIGFGLSSAPILLGRVFGAVAWPHVSVELAAEASLPATTRRQDGAGFSRQYFLVNAAVCAPVRLWNACLVGKAGEVSLAGEIDRPNSARLPFVEMGVRAGVVQSLGTRAFLSAHADGLVTLTRWTATLDRFQVWTSPRLAAAIALEGGVRFP
jgi:hypothetical protein